MKKILLITICILAAADLITAQTEGTLTVTASTSTAGGNFAPKNIVAMWIEDNDGNFVKTMLAYAATRKTHLNTWEASTTAAGSPFNVIDAITGATRTSHGVRTCTWNGTDVNGMLVADGTYKLWMELTDKNGTGNFSSFILTKGPDPENQTPANVPSFSSISVNWDPVPTFIQDPSLDILYRVNPNPTDGIITISGENILETEVLSVNGSLVFKGTAEKIDLSKETDGIYIVKIITEKGPVIKKIMKIS